MNHRKAYTATHYQESQTRSVIPDEHHTTWEESYLEFTKVDHGHATIVVRGLHWCYEFPTL
jgi:hypothetical protein